MALFNNDAFAEPTWLAELPAPLRPTPRSFAVSSLMLRFYESRNLPMMRAIT